MKFLRLVSPEVTFPQLKIGFGLYITFSTVLDGISAGSCVHPIFLIRWILINIYLHRRKHCWEGAGMIRFW